MDLEQKRKYLAILVDTSNLRFGGFFPSSKKQKNPTQFRENVKIF